MTDVTATTILRMIVHKIDHHINGGPILSDMESPLDSEVSGYLLKQIDMNRMSQRSRTAKFLSADNTPVVRDCCDEVFGKNDTFVEMTQKIARHLFESIENDRRISSGDLVVCLFAENNSHQWLAVLKMDPEEGFVGEPEQINGRRRIVLRKVDGVLPRGELQKCAFVLPAQLRANNGYDVIVIDQQAGRSGISQHVASFFITRFLQCDVTVTDQDRMSIFLYQTYAWVDGKKDSWTQDAANELKINTSHAVERGCVDVVAFAQVNIPDVVQQNEYVEHLRVKGLHDLSIQTSEHERTTLVEYTRFQGDRGLEVKVRSDELGDNGTLKWERNEATNEYIVTITTALWEPVLKRKR